MNSQLNFNFIEYNCPVCNKNESKSLKSKVRYDQKNKSKLSICNNCDTVYLSKYLHPNSIKKFYSSIYRKLVGYNNEDLKSFDNRLYLRSIKLLKFLKYRSNKNIKILEIGSGTGATLKFLKEIGFHDLTGIEPNIEEAKYISKTLKLNVINDLFENVKLQDNYYDLVLIISSIDHFIHPQKFLTKVNSILKEGGELFVDFHDINLQLQNNSFFPKLDHPVYYSLHTFNKLLNNCKFEIKEAKYVKKFNYFDQIAIKKDFNYIGCNVLTIKNSFLIKEENNKNKTISSEYKKNVINYFSLFNKLKRKIINIIK